MFGDEKNKKKSDDSQGVLKSSPRGNMDEYEAVREIVAGNPGLLSRVLEKIRAQRTAKSSDGKASGKSAGQNKK